MAGNVSKTTQDSPVSVHEDIALHTATVSLFTDVVLHFVTVSLFADVVVTITSLKILTLMKDFRSPGKFKKKKKQKKNLTPIATREAVFYRVSTDIYL